jgi:predicted nucleic acid-binding Zn ribbon protein
MDGSSEKKATARDLSSVGRLLEGVLANMDLQSRFREHLAVMAWPQIVGAVIGAHTRAETVRDGVLIVATDTAAWAQELHMRRRDLVARVAQQVGPGLIREIHFRSGSVARQGRGDSRLPRPLDMKLSARHEKQIADAAAPIEDPALRARAERAFIAAARIAEWRKRTGWRRCARCGQWQRVGRRWCASCTYSAGRRRRR